MPTLIEIARPARTTDLRDLILEANLQGTTLELRGGASKTDVGRPEPIGLMVEMGGLAGVESYDPTELVLTAKAGTPIREIEALLAANSQMLAFEPPDFGGVFGKPDDCATLGGVVAAGLSGPRRLSAGAVRDHVLGIAGLSGRGVAFKAGGAVVKNVTGYDLPKLMTGSWGTLAALTVITVKVMPRPRTAATLLIAGLTEHQAVLAMSRAAGSPATVTGAAHLPAVKGETPITALRLEGFAPSVQARLRGLQALFPGFDLPAPLDAEASGRFWKEIRDVAAFPADERSLWRISAPPADGWKAVATLRSLGGQAIYDWAGGLIWLALPPSPNAQAPAVRTAVHAVGGHAVLFRAAAEVRHAIAVFDSGPPGLEALSARVKIAFDPKGVLSPQRLLAPSAAG